MGDNVSLINGHIDSDIMKDIKGYEGIYAVTNEGKVWSYNKKIFLKPRKHTKGYMRVMLFNNGNRKDYYIHRLKELNLNSNYISLCCKGKIRQTKGYFFRYLHESEVTK